MAYVGGNMTADELQKQQGLTQVNQPGGGILGAGGVGAKSAVQQSPSGAWTNLRAYLSANAPQAQALAQRVTPQITQMGEEAKSQLEKGVAGYGTELSKYAPNLGLVQEAQTSPTSIVSDPTKLAQFRMMQQGLLGTPTPFTTTSGYGDLSLAAQKGAGLGKIAESEGGKAELLRKLSPSMTKGSVDLNMLLLQGNPQAREMMAAAARPYAGLTDYLKQQEQSLEQQRQATLGQQQQAKKDIEEKVVKPSTQTLKTMGEDIGNRYQQALTEQVNRDELIKNLAAFGRGDISQLSPEAEATFGMRPSGFQTGAFTAGVTSLLENIRQQNPEQFGSPYVKSAGDWIRGLSTQAPVGVATNPTALWMKQNIGQFYDPITQKRMSGTLEPDWMQRYFNTAPSQGTVTMPGVATQEEAAKALALQNLIGEGVTPIFSEADLGQVGSYIAPRIGKYVGTGYGEEGYPLRPV